MWKQRDESIAGEIFPRQQKINKVFRFVTLHKFETYKEVSDVAEKAAKRTNEKTGRGGRIALLVCIGVIVVLLCTVIFLLLKKEDDESETANRGVVVNSSNVEKVAEQMIEDFDPVPAGSYEVTMNSTWYFADGSASSDNAYVENANSNVSDVYFDVTRSDTGETIYSSPVLPVGTYLEDITLDTVLPAGSYDCVIIYHLLNDEGNTQSTVRLTLKIVVEQ